MGASSLDTDGSLSRNASQPIPASGQLNRIENREKLGVESNQRDGQLARVVLHGKTAMRQDVRDAVDQLRQAGHEIEVRVTWESGDAERLAVEAARDQVSVVIAAGGDGTINEVATGILSEQQSSPATPSLGVVPLGTANDFACSCGIPLEPVDALRLALSTDPTPIDAARVDQRFLINVATGGYGPQITEDTSEMLKRILGGAAYFVAGLAKWPNLTPATARFRGPEFEWEGSFAVLAIGNGRQAGGGTVLCPEARIDDGLLDVRILPSIDPEERGQFVQDLLTLGEEAVQNRSLLVRMPWLEVESDEPLHISLDGEPLSRQKLRFEIMPACLSMHLPPNSPLIGTASG